MAHPRILLAGDAALLAELGSLDAVLALFQVTRARRLAGVTDLVPAARTLLAQFEPSVVTPDAVSAWLRRCWQESRGRMHVLANAPAGAGLPARTIEIPVHYTGDDLDEVADRLGLSRAELIERHTAHDFQAAFAGFAPGFVYLTGGDACFHGLPRRPSPRTRVPAGSVAAAGEFSAVYPAESPGGGSCWVSRRCACGIWPAPNRPWCSLGFGCGSGIWVRRKSWSACLRRAR